MAVIGDMGSFADEVLARVARAERRVDVECFIFGRISWAVYWPKRSPRRRVGRSLPSALRPVGFEEDTAFLFQGIGGSWRCGPKVRVGWCAGRWQTDGKAGGARPRAFVVVDDVGYTGGHAWGAEWLPSARGGAGWHDVCCAVEGPIVEDFAALFRAALESVTSGDGDFRFRW